MLDALAGIIIVSVAYAGFREGLFTGFCMLVNVLLAGLVAFTFFEPIADALEGVFKGSFLLGYEDFLALLAPYCLALVLLRIATNNLANRVFDMPGKVQQFGGGAFALLAGYFVAGFFICAMQTLPWHENFFGFEPRSENDSPLRSVFPPDRAWLSLMRYAGAHGLAGKEDNHDGATRYDRFPTFDRWGTFELRYQRYRRRGDQRPPVPYKNELDKELGRK